MGNIQILTPDEHFFPYTRELVLNLEDRLKNPTEEEIERLSQLQRKGIGEIPGLSEAFANEGICNLTGFSYEPESGKTYLDLGLTTGVMAKALQTVFKMPVAGQNPLLVQGMIRTIDDFIVLGVRSKPDSRPKEPNDFKAMFTPAGYVTAHGNPLEEAFYSELAEETGLQKDDIICLKTLGHNRDIGFTYGTRITFLANTPLTFKQFQERWKNAPHSWEYAQLIGLKNDEPAIRNFLMGDIAQHSQLAEGLVESSVRPALTYYADNFKSLSKIQIH